MKHFITLILLTTMYTTHAQAESKLSKWAHKKITTSEISCLVSAFKNGSGNPFTCTVARYTSYICDLDRDSNCTLIQQSALKRGGLKLTALSDLFTLRIQLRDTLTKMLAKLTPSTMQKYKAGQAELTRISYLLNIIIKKY